MRTIQNKKEVDYVLSQMQRQYQLLSAVSDRYFINISSDEERKKFIEFVKKGLLFPNGDSLSFDQEIEELRPDFLGYTIVHMNKSFYVRRLNENGRSRLNISLEFENVDAFINMYNKYLNTNPIFSL